MTSGLGLWLEADAINATDAAEVRVTGSGSFVQSWVDQSGNGIATTQTSLAYQPVYIASGMNGLPVLRFDGSKRFLTTGLSQIVGDKSIFVVQRRTAGNGGCEIGTSSLSGLFFGNSGSSEAKGRFGIAYDESVPASGGSPVVKDFVRSGSSETLRVNGVSSTSANLPDATPTGTYMVANGIYTFAGDIAEVIVYNRALSAAETQAVEAYLTNKWGVTLPLPVTTGLSAWFAANAINTSDTTQVVLSGTQYYVTRWPDGSGNKADAVQSTPSRYPLYSGTGLNGLPVLQFDGTPRFLTSKLAQIAGDKTIFVIQNRTATTSGKEVSSSGGTGHFLGNNVSYETKGRIGVAHDLSLPGNLNNTILKVYIRSGAGESLWVDDVAATGSAPDLAAGNYTISSATSPFTGSIAEVIVYHRALSDAERQSVESYLKAKWNLYGSALPVTSGLAMWLDANAININDPSQVAVSGSTLSLISWRDRSSPSGNASQSTASYQPTVVTGTLNGLPVVRFNGSVQYLRTTLQQITGDKSIFIVHRRTSVNTGTELAGNGSSSMFLGNASASETKGRMNVATDLSVSGNVGNVVLESFIRASGSETLTVGASSASGLPPDRASGVYTISHPYYPYTGDIAEVIVYNRAVTSAESQLIEDYLAAKWNIPSVLVPVTSGLMLWLDAGSILTTDPLEVRTDPNSGTMYVAQWPSRSGNGTLAAQNVASAQPQLVPNALNGQPVVRFDGTSSYMTSSLPQIKGDKSIFIVQRRSAINYGTEIGSNAGSGIFFGYNNGYEAEGRINVAYDLELPGSITTPLIKSLVVSGTSFTLSVDGSSVSAAVPDAYAGTYTLSSQAYPFQGDIAEVLIYNRALSGSEVATVENYLNTRWNVSDIRCVTPDLVAPPMVTGTPAPGLRVQMTTAGYPSSVYHTLYLPTDWQPGRKYPIIVDFPPNASPADGDIGTTGLVEDISLGYGITGGTGCIWISMPIIGGSPLANETVWWDDIPDTEAYCIQTIQNVCRNYGGDSSAVILSGFSRGAIGCNYIGLADDTIADVWLAFIPHAHYDGQITTWPYPGADDVSALTRLDRLEGRWQHISEETALTSAQGYLESTGVSMEPFTFETLPYFNHCDIWALRPIQLRTDVRAWLATVLANKPATYSISGQVVDANGNPVPNVEIDSGPTHYTISDANGNYTLAGLVNSIRSVTASLSGYTFPPASVTINGANVTGVTFQSQ